MPILRGRVYCIFFLVRQKLEIIILKKSDLFMFSFTLISKPFGKLIVANLATCLFFNFFTCAKFQKDWTTFILDILQSLPFEFLVDYKNKKHPRRDSYKISNINVVQGLWNFAQLKKIKQVTKIWWLYLEKQKVRATMYLLSRTFGR